MISPAAAQDFADGPLVLDGNAESEVGGSPPDDWQDLETGGGAASAFTFQSDPSPQTIFTTGGSKDPLDVTSWKYKNGNVPDKDDITNAYAASYTVPDGGGGQDLIIYFGADRLATSGDAQLGFWFFQSAVGPGAGNTFTGSHVVGDILALAHFSNGGAVATIEVFEWVGSGGTHGSLDLIESGAMCDPAVIANVCAITNSADSNAPWDYTPKAGTDGVFPPVSFFEGGINLTQIFGDGAGSSELPCFSSFLAETRSSTSTTAVLKDFVADGFPVCGIELTKFCGSGTINDAGTGWVYGVGGSVTNTGFGTLYDVDITEIFPASSTRADGSPLQPGDGVLTQIPSIGPGQTLCWNGDDPTVTGNACNTIEVLYFGNPNTGTTNNASVVSAVSNGGAQTVVDMASDTCDADLPEVPIDVMKSCETVISLNTSDELVIGVEFEGMVCNESALQLTINSVTNNQPDPDNPTSLTPSKSVLPPYDDTDANPVPAHCATYSGSYFPSSGSAGLGRLSFSDTITAKVSPTISSTVEITDYGYATCYLCVDGDGEACPLD